MPQERRQQRSEHYPRALRYQLETAAERLGAQNMVLSGHEGFLILSTQDAENNDDIAAMSCKMAQRKNFWSGSYHNRDGQRQLAVQRFETPNGAMFLCAVNPANTRSMQNELGRSGQGVARILADHF